MTEMKIVVVGFTMNRKRSVGYDDFGDEGKAAQYVYKLLAEKGADVISIRRVFEE